MKTLEHMTDDEFADVVRQAVALREAPAHVIRSAVALWPSAQPSRLEAVAETAGRALNVVRAVLSFDSWNIAPMALGVRSLPSNARHLLFSAEGRDIDLRITPSTSDFVMAGQILGPDESGTIELRSSSDDQAQARLGQVAALDDLGEFRLEGIPRGRYVLTLRMSDEVVELPPIDVGDRSD